MNKSKSIKAKQSFLKKKENIFAENMGNKYQKGVTLIHISKLLIKERNILVDNVSTKQQEKEV